MKLFTSTRFQTHTPLAAFSSAIVVLFRFRPCAGFAMNVNLDVYHICPAADRTVFDIHLTGPSRRIDGDHDFLATCIAGIGCFVDHALQFHVPKACRTATICPMWYAL